MNKVRLILIIANVLVAQGLLAQNVTEQMKKVRNAYVFNKQFMFDVEAYSYESKMDVTPSLISKGCVKKDNEKYYSKFEDVELLINGKRSLLVNNRLKKMTYNECNVMKKPDANEVQKALDSFSTTDSVVLGDSKNGDIHFIAYSKTGYIQRTDLYVDSKTLFVKHILYQYVPPNDEYDMDVDRIEIFYKN